jgi:nitrate reductase delta subunit
MTSTTDAAAVRRLLASASLLLSYPDESVLARVPTVLAAVDSLPRESREEIRAAGVWLRAVDPLRAQSHYVEIFDRRRRACLYLTYFLNGDTRRRGMALVEFKEAYQSAGFDLGTGELPDFLPVVLEFGAVGDLAAALEMLAVHRSGLEVLEAALERFDSPYSQVVTGLLTVVPPAPAGPTAEELALAGPPVEQVGLAPFVPVESLTIGARS